MYYIVRKDEGITKYHSVWTSYYNAVEEADALKVRFNREYEIFRMEIVYATLTLRDLEK